MGSYLAGMYAAASITEEDLEQMIGEIVQGEIVEIRTERIASVRPFFVGPLATGVTHHYFGRLGVLKQLDSPRLKCYVRLTNKETAL